MSKVRNSIIALAVLVISVLVGLGQGTDQPLSGRPGDFYLTQTQHNGAQALNACAPTYHMASLWEIHDPSKFRYNTQRGLTSADSGLGPPMAIGWARSADSDGCLGWTSADESNTGAIISLNPDFIFEESTSPWRAISLSCDSNLRVWCVRD